MADDKICYPRVDVLGVLRSLETIVTSLDRIGAATLESDPIEADKILGAFIRDWQIFRELASARRILSTPFSTEVAGDSMDELEREMINAPTWSIDHRRPPQS